MHCAKQFTQALLYHYTAQRDWHHHCLTSPIYHLLPVQVICLSALRCSPYPSLELLCITGIPWPGSIDCQLLSMRRRGKDLAGDSTGKSPGNVSLARAGVASWAAVLCLLWLWLPDSLSLNNPSRPATVPASTGLQSPCKTPAFFAPPDLDETVAFYTC